MVDAMTDAFMESWGGFLLKPSQKKQKTEAVKVFPDGREVCNGRTAAGVREYRRRREFMYARDKGICCICELPIRHKDEATWEHSEGRGMGGFKRDDRTEKDGKPYNGVAHLVCNTEKGSRH